MVQVSTQSIPIFMDKTRCQKQMKYKENLSTKLLFPQNDKKCTYDFLVFNWRNSSSKRCHLYLKKLKIFVSMWNWGQFRENLIRISWSFCTYVSIVDGVVHRRSAYTFKLYLCYFVDYHAYYLTYLLVLFLTCVYNNVVTHKAELAGL